MQAQLARKVYTAYNVKTRQKETMVNPILHRYDKTGPKCKKGVPIPDSEYLSSRYFLRSVGSDGTSLFRSVGKSILADFEAPSVANGTVHIGVRKPCKARKPRKTAGSPTKKATKKRSPTKKTAKKTSPTKKRSPAKRTKKVASPKKTASPKKRVAKKTTKKVECTTVNTPSETIKECITTEVIPKKRASVKRRSPAKKASPAKKKASPVKKRSSSPKAKSPAKRRTKRT
jgi:hypothetical protein